MSTFAFFFVVLTIGQNKLERLSLAVFQAGLKFSSVSDEEKRIGQNVLDTHAGNQLS
jgi:hypothetical protein